MAIFLMTMAVVLMLMALMPTLMVSRVARMPYHNSGIESPSASNSSGVMVAYTASILIDANSTTRTLPRNTIRKPHVMIHAVPDVKAIIPIVPVLIE